MVKLNPLRSKYFPLFAAGRLTAWWLGIVVLACSGHLAFAQTLPAFADVLSSYEQSLFSRDYSGEPRSARLERLESSVFGGLQSGTDAERQERLVKALAAAKQVIPVAPGKSDATSQSDASGSTGINRYTSPNAGDGGNVNASPDQADAVGNGDRSSAKDTLGTEGGLLPNARLAGDSDYPSVTALEREVFGRDFLREDVTHRLDRLERRAFGQASAGVPLADRVDRLMAQYPNAAAEVARYTRAASGQSADGPVSSALRDLPGDSGQFVGNLDTYTKVSSLEKRFFNGKTYSGELLTQRLNRLEAKAYGHSYAGQSVDTRVNRLIGAYRVGSAARKQPSSDPILRQPDPAKWQSPETVGYTGSFISQRNSWGAGYGNTAVNPPTNMAPPSSAPQNIQIGAGFGSTSTSTFGGFSPEMVSMLPPGVQQQVSQQQASGMSTQQQSGTTVIGAPGTVITQQTTPYPGFQTYNGQPIQTYSYYGNPVSQTQSSTTIIQPDGSAVAGPVTYSTQGGAMPNTVNGLPTPVYTGDPTVLQSLGNLEINVFGQVDMLNPVAVRLARLEMQMLRQVYSNYPDAQRVANLQRAYQLQSVNRMLGNSKAANLGRAAGSMLFGVPLNNPNPVALPNTAIPAPTIVPSTK